MTATPQPAIPRELSDVNETLILAVVPDDPEVAVAYAAVTAAAQLDSNDDHIAALDTLVDLLAERAGIEADAAVLNDIADTFWAD